MTKTTWLTMFASLLLAAALVAQPGGQRTGPDVVVNPKAHDELKGLDLTAPSGVTDHGGKLPDGTAPPGIPLATPNDENLGAGRAHDANQANKLVDRHRPKTRESQTLFGVAIACGAALVLIVGIVLGRRRS